MIIIYINMLTNFDLFKIAQNANIPLNAVCLKDELPNLKNKNGYYIINLSSSTDNNGGTHWTSLIIENDNAFYNDSFGASPPIEIKNFCNNCTLAYSDDIIQDLSSNNCGYFSFMSIMYYHLMRKNNIPFIDKFDNYLRNYTNNRKYNDYILQQLYKKYYPKKIKLINRLLKEKIILSEKPKYGGKNGFSKPLLLDSITKKDEYLYNKLS